jgi:hypothetical protein
MPVSTPLKGRAFPLSFPAGLLVKERVGCVKAQGRIEDLSAAREGSVAGSDASAGLEESHWLCAIEDRRRLDSTREGMPEGFSLGGYISRSAEGGLLVDYSGRLFREGKATISREVAKVFERVATTTETWQARLEKLSEGRLLGRFPDGIGTLSLAASSRAPGLREVEQRLGLRRAINLGRCLVT